MNFSAVFEGMSKLWAFISFVCETRELHSQQLHDYQYPLSFHASTHTLARNAAAPTRHAHCGRPNTFKNTNNLNKVKHIITFNVFHELNTLPSGLEMDDV